MDGRLILVSNRLPISARTEHGELLVSRSSGGLATGLWGYHARGDGVWIGWPGETWRLSDDQRGDLWQRLEQLTTVPVELTEQDAELYYEGFSNGVLWPLLHYQVDRLPLEQTGWEAYQRVNQAFADVVVKFYRPGDYIWIHDYHLMLVPALVRRALPQATIGYFCHVPFPSSELFRVLRQRRELLEGLLGSTLVGFHTSGYARHFASAAARILGCETRPGRVRFGDRVVRVTHFPMGIDAEGYDKRARADGVAARARQFQGGREGVDLLLSVDRLDYTKGIPRRLLAFERYLERHPERRGHVRLMQVASPSRESVEPYRDLRRTVNELVGRINGRFATDGVDPIHYVARTLSADRLVELYRAASVALVTPLRDGMNLVAKEFVASRSDEDGVLILSEFAGAAAELTGALLVNPYDVDGVADAIHVALTLRAPERRRRMRALRQRVMTHDVGRWAREYLEALELAASEDRRIDPAASAASAQQIIADALFSSRPARVSLILDYDGTLVPLRGRPEESEPDDDVLALLTALASLPAVDLHIVSGRHRHDLDRSLSFLPAHLHAEHGWWSRASGQSRWIAGLLEGESVVIAETESALKLRTRVPDKGAIVEDLASSPDPGVMLIVGDDETDEPMFASAPANAVTVKVGPGPTVARYRLASPDQVRALLSELLDRARDHAAAETLVEDLDPALSP